jgi:hypothetical protein
MFIEGSKKALKSLEGRENTNLIRLGKEIGRRKIN